MSKPPTSRGEETRRRILDATLEVIASEGVPAVTHRRVAAEAKASMGLITYYFTSTEELVISALGTLADREADRLEGLRATITPNHGVPEFVELLVQMVRSASAEGKRAEMATVALTLEIPRHGVPRDPFRRWEEAQIELFTEICTCLGSEDPESVGLFLLATIEGLSLYAAITVDPKALERGARTGLTTLLEAVSRRS